MQPPTLFAAFAVRMRCWLSLLSTRIPARSQQGSCPAWQALPTSLQKVRPTKGAELSICPHLISWGFLLNLSSTLSRSITLNGSPTLNCIGCTPWFGVIHKFEKHILHLLLQVTDKNIKQERSLKSLLRNSTGTWPLSTTWIIYHHYSSLMIWFFTYSLVCPTLTPKPLCRSLDTGMLQDSVLNALQGRWHPLPSPDPQVYLICGTGIILSFYFFRKDDKTSVKT